MSLLIPISIELTSSEIMGAAITGVMRQTQNLKLGRKPAYGAGKDNDWQLNIEGALGEAALAKHLDHYWLGTGVLRSPDVGKVDVRTTTHPKGRLIIHKEDPDDRRFYLLIGCNGKYMLHGSIMGADAKRDEWWSDPNTGRPAYFVPQSALGYAVEMS